MVMSDPHQTLGCHAVQGPPVKTWRAYASYWRRFSAWCLARDLEKAGCIAVPGCSHPRPAKVRLPSSRSWPASRRSHGIAPVRKHAADANALRDLLRAITGDELRSVHDRALLAFCMAGAFRRSELIVVDDREYMLHVKNILGVHRLTVSLLRFDAVVFDLLTGLLDSWTVWNHAAGSAVDGLQWRCEYLRLTYGCGAYQTYEDLVGRAARTVGLRQAHADALMTHWGELQPWSEVAGVLGTLSRRGVPLGVATNCSIEQGRRAAARIGVPLAAIVTSEEAGFYKPRPEPYQAVLDRLGTAPERTLFVAGSPADVPGATGVGMPVFWHNRAGLPFVADGARPFLVADTLHPLLELA